MARGFTPRGGAGGNMNALVKQAQKMQENMLKAQQELDQKEFTASSGGGAVTVTVLGKKQIKSIELSEAAVDPDDIEMLQDLIIAAVNEAFRIAEETISSEMGKLTGGLNLGF